MFVSRRLIARAGVGLILWAASWAGPPGPTRAADETTGDPVSLAALDDRIDDALLEVINAGRKLYNAKQYTEAASFFRGGLTSVRPLLGHRPRAQQLIDRGLGNARPPTSGWEPAWALRKVLDAVRDELAPDMASAAKGKTLWDRLGRERNVTRIVGDFIDAAIADKDVDFSRGGKYELTPAQVREMKRHFVCLASALGGGPLKYKGRRMIAIHKGMGITDDEFDALLGHLKFAMLQNHVRPKEVSYVMEMIALTRADIVRKPRDSAEKPPAATLWERLGGEKGVTKIVDDFIDAAIADKAVDFSRGGKYELTPARVRELKRHFVRLASAAGEGPLKYEGRSMKTLHKGMGITDDEFDAVLKALKLALVRNRVKPEDSSTIMQAIGSTRKDIVEPRAGKKPARPAPAPAGGADAGRNRAAPAARGETPPASLGELVVQGCVLLIAWVLNRALFG